MRFRARRGGRKAGGLLLALLMRGGIGGAQAGDGSAILARVRNVAATPAQGAKAIQLPPNELGRIPILEYHAIGGPAEFANGPRYDIHGLNIAPDTFRRQLALMYAAGWYPINMRDALAARLRVPKGKIPVVLTFDDARPSQFRCLSNGKLDPDCAVGILEAFHAKRPDWPRRAAFYVLPESKWNGVPFDQDGLETRKLRFLARRGYEIGNHTTSHRSLADLSVATLQWEMATSARYLHARVPRLRLDTMALPYGIAPRDPARWHYLLRGAQGGVAYRNRCILLANGEPSFAPADRRYNAHRIMRVTPAPGRIEGWIEKLRPGRSPAPFVSDGDPEKVTVPQSELGNLNRAGLQGARLVVLPDARPIPAPNSGE